MFDVYVNVGHVIDGNLHFNVTTPGNFKHDPEVQNLLEPYIFETVARRNGSISAEHGLGRCKNQYMGKFAKNAAAVEIMKNLKKMFDPNNILNPGKYLPNDQNDSDNC
jgi:FAD/FMN-containing dehydrogenase